MGQDGILLQTTDNLELQSPEFIKQQPPERALAQKITCRIDGCALHWYPAVVLYRRRQLEHSTRMSRL